MRLTARDVRLVRDVALSHVLSRDQIIQLGYFSSVTRTNTRLRELRVLGLVRLLETPFYSQSLYFAGSRAAAVVGEKIAPLLAYRTGSPRFLQHALSVTNVRLALLKKGDCQWRFEQQLRFQFRYAGRDFEVRPDGMAVTPSGCTLVEVDLGHVAPAKFKEKLRGFEALIASGECKPHYGYPNIRLLAVTTGNRRAASLLRLAPRNSLFEFVCQPFAELGAPYVGAWS